MGDGRRIHGCFDKISHEWMLDHILTDKAVLRKWLQAGFMENRTLFPAEAGTPQDGIISPTPANLTQDGLEQLLKWDWMADKKVYSLEALFDDRAMFTHMGGTWGKTQELSTIKSGGIWYKKTLVYAADVRIFESAAVILKDMDLQAVVGSHEVTNAFMVTKVYSKQNGKWKLDKLTFSHLLRPVKAGSDKK